MPNRFRSSVTSTRGAKMSSPSKRTFPSMRTPSMMSFIRFRQRRSVDLPQPDGPMSAVTFFSGSSMEMSYSACFSP